MSLSWKSVIAILGFILGVSVTLIGVSHNAAMRDRNLANDVAAPVVVPVPTVAPTPTPTERPISEAELRKLINEDQIAWSGQYNVIQAIEIVTKSGQVITTGPLTIPEWSKNKKNFVVDTNKTIIGSFTLSDFKGFLNSEGFTVVPAPTPIPTPVAPKPA